MNWKRLLKRIPHKVQVTAKVAYSILWATKEIHRAEDCYGVTHLDTKQIILTQGQTPKEAVHTYLHEILHSFSEEYDIGLTESQVRKCERALYYILKEGNVFSE
jgi:predicted GTPase